ncbi:MAG: hypothetical protein PHP35_00005, partial [Candidatus Colwellbacteria bacterium]|nr:hypothetical protein [Candidatus Colwellbacteria bacterium]
STVFIDERHLCYLDDEATAMFKDLSLDEIYCLADLEEKYGEELRSFLTQLYERNIWIDVD